MGNDPFSPATVDVDVRWHNNAGVAIVIISRLFTARSCDGVTRQKPRQLLSS